MEEILKMREKATKLLLNKAKKLATELERKKRLKLLSLQREVKMIAEKKRLINEKWTQIILKVDDESAKKAIQAAAQAFDRACDRRAGVIAHIFKLINCVDDQHIRNKSKFTITVEEEIQAYLDKINTVCENFERKTAEVIKQSNEEFISLQSHFDHGTTNLNLLTYYGQTLFEEDQDRIRGHNIAYTSDNTHRNDLELNGLVSLLENKCGAMWKDIKAELRNYIVNITPLTKRTRVLRRKVTHLIDTIQTQAFQIEQSEATKQSLQRELDSIYASSKLNCLVTRRENIRQALKNLTQKLAKDRAHDARMIQLLVTRANEAHDRIMECGKVCKKIIIMISLCRKYETLKEKILPIGMPKIKRIPREQAMSVGVALRRLVMKSTSLVSTVGIDSSISATYDYRTLYYRMGRVKLLCRTLQSEINILLEENERIAAHLEKAKEEEVIGVTSKCLCPMPAVCKGVKLPAISKPYICTFDVKTLYNKRLKFK